MLPKPLDATTCVTQDLGQHQVCPIRMVELKETTSKHPPIDYGATSDAGLAQRQRGQASCFGECALQRLFEP